MFEFTSALTLGLIGSIHCAGMCGPIAIALPFTENRLSAVLSKSLLYNSGRAFTYFILGLLFGILGKGLNLDGFQHLTSIIVGASMIVIILFQYTFLKKYTYFQIPLLANLKMGLAKLLSIQSTPSLFFVGLLNGLLPCGMVYVALAGSLSAQGVLGSGFYMFLFGMGTIPMLVAITVMGNALSSSFRNKLNKMIPAMVVFIGILFILRGMSLGIPFLSPDKSLEVNQPSQTHSCCKVK